jgi:hypothetical protein
MICRHLNKPNPAAAYAEALWRHFKKKMDRIEAGRMNLSAIHSIRNYSSGGVFQAGKKNYII